MRNYKNEAIGVISLDSVTVRLLASEESHGSRRPGAPSGRCVVVGPGFRSEENALTSLTWRWCFLLNGQNSTPP